MIERPHAGIRRNDCVRRAHPARAKLPILSALLSAGLIGLLTGCQVADGQKIKTDYGRVSGSNYRTSVNGTKVLANMLEALGKNVDKTSRLSPRIDRYDTIIFFSQDRSPPTQETIDRIDTWLSENYFRTFIYVGRDFDAEVEYWRAILEQSDVTGKSHARRRLARAMATQDQARHGMQPSSIMIGSVFNPLETECEWYIAESHSHQNATSLNGPLAVGVEEAQSDISYHTLLAPNPKYPGSAETLLTSDGHVFAFSLQRHEWNESRIIIVSNGSFLLNYSLINIENRVLTNNLFQQLPYAQDILLLESGSDVAISESEYENHNRWSWITKPPLKYIVPQFLFWGILFCFVFFPIFGRPRHTANLSTTNFKQHISAMGRLLLRTKSPDQIMDWVKDYRASSSKHGRKTRDPDKSESE